MRSIRFIFAVVLMGFLCRSSFAQTNQKNFDEFAQRYVSAPFGLVDYHALRVNHGLIDAYLNEVAQADLKSMEANDRLATLINAYNAAMVKIVLEHYPVKSVKDIPERETWKDVRWSIGGKMFSLEQIRDELIMKSNDPRALFAIVDAARGSGPLRSEAYTAERLNAQLEEQMKWTHSNGSQYVNYDPQTRTLKLSEIYKRFQAHFVKTGGSVEKYVAKYNLELKTALDAGEKVKIEYVEFDWRVNSTG